ncbi:uncharacterized protein ARMOST_11687 [Armillaria ostoyae]|uniref:Uncharacterized protein n=1 Tax=Armillaria ostoyae TaxID=47428 RepID=A0A284RHT9_ARMOS|nr:uncharacterized protein ARMOST_11687 [Armillaria ostoyae]
MLQACQQAHWDFYNVCGWQTKWQLWKRLLKDQKDYRLENLDESLHLEKEIWQNMILEVKSIGISDLDAMIKMPMPELDLEEEVKKKHHQQMTAKMRAKKHEKDEEVESEVEMYEDLELVLVQEVEKEKEKKKDVEMAGLSGAS